jgi:hypothetical protein
MKTALLIATSGIITLASLAQADTQLADKPPLVDQGTMNQMKQKTQQAMQKHKGWIDRNMQGWPEKTREVAAVTIASYGEPQSAGPDLIVWGKSGPWKRIVLHREELAHSFPMPHKDVLQQFVNVAVPADKFDDLAKYDGSVVAERTAGELSARCDKEEANFLAINLAVDVAQGRKSVDEARDYYANAIKQMLAGKVDPYMKGLKIPANTATVGDPDQARFGNPMARNDTTQQTRP